MAAVPGAYALGDRRHSTLIYAAKPMRVTYVINFYQYHHARLQL